VDRLTDSGTYLVERSEDRVPAGEDRQRPRLRLQGVRQNLPQPGSAAHRHQPYTRRTNGKAERFIKTLLGKWGYAMPF